MVLVLHANLALAPFPHPPFMFSFPPPSYEPPLSLTHPPSPVDSPSSGEEWSAWSVCSATCGEGWQSRTRFCVSSSYITQCSGPLREQRPCNNSAVCPGKAIQRGPAPSHQLHSRLATDHPTHSPWHPFSVCPLAHLPSCLLALTLPNESPPLLQNTPETPP